MAQPNAHTEAPGHAKVFPPFQPENYASQLVWLGLTFVLLYVVMAKIALPRVGAIIEARRSRIESDIAEAGRLKSDAEAAMAAYEEALAAARARAHAIAAEMREKLDAEAALRRNAIERELNVRLAAAERAIGESKARAMVSVREIAVEAAAAIVARLTGSAPAEPAVVKAVDTVLKR